MLRMSLALILSVIAVLLTGESVYPVFEVPGYASNDVRVGTAGAYAQAGHTYYGRLSVHLCLRTVRLSAP